MASDRDNSDSFRSLVGEVRPIRQDRVMRERRAVPPDATQRERDAREVIDSLMTHEIDPAWLETGDELGYLRQGLRPMVLRRLRRGDYVVEHELDLHGFTVAEAHEALSAFLAEARSRGMRCVRIVHGKGRGSPGQLPVLKNKVALWLRRRDDVLAYCSARPVDGGTGAAYVLLKRR